VSHLSVVSGVLIFAAKLAKSGHQIHSPKPKQQRCLFYKWPFDFWPSIIYWTLTI